MVADIIGTTEIPILSQVADIGSGVSAISRGDIASGGASFAGATPGIGIYFNGWKWFKRLRNLFKASKAINKNLDYFIKLLKPKDEFDFSRKLFRGTTGSEAGSATLFLTDNAKVAETYIKNGGQVVQYEVSLFSLKALQSSGELTMKKGLHGATGKISNEYMFHGEKLVEALNSIAKPVN